ncbi:hypothetical protein [Vagococcus lutrae]|uniref:hypothetical protein n=1 Tax=Vagococcus lutrae TaxID=81947 RepID=UPI0028903304|nr:hypothetical protein [Vagococcus lutrae]MDT2824369.1 hypothetical protein [Vagococcus lutrae]
MTYKQFEEKLKRMQFGLKKDFEDIDAVTVTRGAENIADIYADGRFTTCFFGFLALPVKEKQELTALISEYACGIMEG